MPARDLSRDVLLRALRAVQASRISRWVSHRPIRILTYHGFTNAPTDSIGGYVDTHVDAFRAQLRHLKRYYSVVPVSDVVEHLTVGKPLPPRPVVITIDDGYRSVHTLAFPALREVQLPASLFPATDFIDGKGLMWTDRVKACVAAARAQITVEIPTRNGDVPVMLGGPHKRKEAREIVNLLLVASDDRRKDALDRLEKALGRDLDRVPRDSFQPMSWDDIDEMVGSGLITPGSHTCSHPLLPLIPDEELTRELGDSKRAIESRYGACDVLCYPYGGPGAFDERVGEFARAAGYRCALTTVGGTVSRGDDLFQLQRLGAPDDPLKFDFAMSGLGSVLSDSKRRMDSFIRRPAVQAGS